MADVNLSEDSINRLADLITSKSKEGNKDARGTKFSTQDLAKSGKDLGQTMFTADAGFKNLTGAVKDATKAIPIVNKFSSAIDFGTGYIDETADTFRTLSKVGGGAAGELFQLRMRAAESRLPLDTFASLVANNSELLAGFAGGVTGGEKRLAEMGNALFQDGIIEKFLNLGYSVEEAVELSLKQQAVQRRRFMMEEMSATDQAAATAAYAKDLSVIAKLTGKQADQIADEMRAAQADGAVRAKMRMLEKQGITGATAANEAAMLGMAKGSEAQKLAMKEILTLGAPVSEAARNFVAANGAAADLMYQTKAAIESGDAAGAKKLSEQSLAAAIESGDSMENLYVATLKSVSDFGATQAEVLEQTANVTDQILEQQKEMSETNGRFVTLSEAFIGTLAELNKEVDEMARGTGEGRKSLKASNTANAAVVDETNKNIHKLNEELEGNSLVQGALDNVTENVGDVVGELGTKIRDGVDFIGTMTGDKQAEMARTLEQAGLSEAADVLKNATDNQAKQKATELLINEGYLDAQGNLTQSVIDAAKKNNENLANQSTSGVGSSGPIELKDENLLPEKSAPIKDTVMSVLKLLGIPFPMSGRELGGPVESSKMYTVGEAGPEMFMSNTAGNIMSNQDLQLATLGPELGNKFSTLAQEMQAFGAPITQAAQEAMASGITPEALQKMEDTMNQVKNQISAPDTASSPDLIKMMQQLVDINKKTMETANKTYRTWDNALKGIN